MKAAFIVLTHLLLCLSFAQTRLAGLSVNGAAYDEAGTFYFADFGNTQDAFAEAEAFGVALGLNVSLAEYGALTFEGPDIFLSLEVADNAAAGLQKKLGALYRDGEALESPLAIRVDGVFYVAVSPLVEALGGSSAFDYDNGTLRVEVAAPEPLTAAEAATPSATAVQTQLSELGTPRTGRQEDGSTRVVVDLPAGSDFSLAVQEDAMLISFSGVSLPQYSQAFDDVHLNRLEYGAIAGRASLVIGVNHGLSPDGAGFRSGLVPAAADSPRRLFVDFAPNLQGESVALAESLELSGEPLGTRAAETTRKVVVIDAGHGGHDPGAVGYVREEDVVLPVALKLRDILVAQGVKVILTRDHDTFLELRERAAFASPDINLFISIHANSVDNTAAHGIETWVFGVPLEQDILTQAIEENGGGAEGAALTQEALAFANSIPGKIVQEEQLRFSMALAEQIQSSLVRATGARDRGIRKNAFYVIRNARTAAILVELGFVSHPQEGPKLASEAYQQTLAESLASGVTTFLSEGFVANRD